MILLSGFSLRSLPPRLASAWRGGLGMAALALLPGLTHAQIGIGTRTPDPNAALDIRSTDKGLLIPRMDSVSRLAIQSPPDGLLVFQQDGRKGFWYAIGGAWVYLPDKGRPLADNLGNHTATQPLKLGTNALVGTANSLGTAVGVGVTAKGALNIGQNTNYNLAIGYEAGAALTSGTNNQFVGYGSGAATTSGIGNYFSGYWSGHTNTTGSNNHFSGTASGMLNTTGSDNQFIGQLSGVNNTTGNSNQFIGQFTALANTTGYNNQFIGYEAGQANTIGYANQFVGFNAGKANTNGGVNLFVGYESGLTNTSGWGNSFIGYKAGLANTTGIMNIFVGANAGLDNTTGQMNQFIGVYAGANNTTGSRNQFSGFYAGNSNRQGFRNFFSGYECGAANMSGNNNLFIGYQSGHASRSGNNNLFIGYLSGDANVTGSNNWAIGYEAGPTTAALTNAGALGYQAKVSQNNALVLGGTGPFAVNVGIGTTAPQRTLDVNGTIRQQTYTSGQLHVAAGTNTYYDWYNGLGYQPVLMVTIDQTGGGGGENVLVSYQHLSNTSTRFWLKNTQTSGIATFQLRWIRVD